MDIEAKEKRSYEAPRLLEHGTVEELTHRQKSTGPTDGDFVAISVQGLMTVSGLP